MKTIAICSNNYEVAKAASSFIFGEYNYTASHVFRSMLPSAYCADAYFVVKWHGYRFKVVYKENNFVKLYVYNK